MKTKYIISLSAAIIGVSSLSARAEVPNTLSDAEKAGGWQLLWDGKTLNGWVGEKNGCKTPPTKGWKIEDGILTVLPRSGVRGKKLPKEQSALGGGGDLVTVKDYRDFELSVDFRLTEAADPVPDPSACARDWRIASPR